ncbi:MAG: hypothetical protein AB8D78_06395 [Akkermansiaceae bacterium]
MFKKLFSGWRTSVIPLTQLVRDRVDDLFPERDRGAARAILEQHFGFSLPLIPGIKPETYNPVRCAALKLSEGDLKVLEELIPEAHHDWRDVLIAAGFGWDTEAHKNWRPTKQAEQDADGDPL